MNTLSKKMFRMLTLSLSCLLFEVKFQYHNDEFKEYNDSIQNENLECFIEALDKLGKKPRVLDYNSHVARVATTNGYEYNTVYYFDYADNQISSVKSIKTAKKNIKRVSSLDSSDSYTYDEDGRLVSILRPNAEYSLEYNDYGNIINEKVNGNSIKTYTYNVDGKINSIDFVNGYHSDFSYDENNNLINITDSNDNLYNYEYHEGRMTGYLDKNSSFESHFSYDDSGMLAQSIDSNGLTKSLTYDNSGNIIHKAFVYDGLEMIEDENGNNGLFVSEKTNDISDRIRFSKLLDRSGFSYTQEYQYLIDEPLESELGETNYNDTIDNATDDTKVSCSINPWVRATYTYDSAGNIDSYDCNSNSETYSYDENGELIEYKNSIGNHSIQYDEYGNIVQKDGLSYIYDTSSGFDELVMYGAEAFEYDLNGNPVIYRNKNLFWSGKRLCEIEGIASYLYNGVGIRTTKVTKQGVTHYILDGNKVIFEHTEGNKPIQFLYSSTSSKDPIGLVYQGERFYYVKDARKDILGIVNVSGKQVVSYKYDPWGKMISLTGRMATTLGKDNPYRYRSYRFDNETGFYYLDSRYYDPEVGRFISPDNLSNLQYTVLEGDYSKNLYCYCNNSPVNRIDPTGNMSVLALNFLKVMYSDLKIIQDAYISTPVLALNGLVYNAFHETAQLIAAKELSKEGYVTQLEFPNGNRKEADILAYRGINYLYEVKPYGTSISAAYLQLHNYILNTGFVVGQPFSSYEIDFLPYIKMNVFYQSNGIVEYEFYKEKKRWKNKQVKELIAEERVEKTIRITRWIALGVAITIMASTLLEDVLTGGAGIADDQASIQIAASSYRSLMCFSLKFA